MLRVSTSSWGEKKKFTNFRSISTALRSSNGTAHWHCALTSATPPRPVAIAQAAYLWRSLVVISNSISSLLFVPSGITDTIRSPAVALLMAPAAAECTPNGRWGHGRWGGRRHKRKVEVEAVRIKHKGEVNVVRISARAAARVRVRVGMAVEVGKSVSVRIDVKIEACA